MAPLLSSSDCLWGAATFRTPWKLTAHSQGAYGRQPAVAQGALTAGLQEKVAGAKADTTEEEAEGIKEEKKAEHNLAKVEALQKHHCVHECSEMPSKLCSLQNRSFLLFFKPISQRVNAENWPVKNYKRMWYFWLVLVPRNLCLRSRVQWAHKLSSEVVLYIQYTWMVEVFNIPLKTRMHLLYLWQWTDNILKCNYHPKKFKYKYIDSIPS